MAQDRPTTRIGDSDRAAAREALDAHLNAGRLRVEEYSERSATATNATTAGELADLFTDLPAPHPKLPGMRGGPGGWQRPVIVLGTVGALVLGVIVVAAGLAHGGAQPSSSNQAGGPTSAASSAASVTASPSASASPNSAAAPTDTADGSVAPTASVVPAGAVTVRHHGLLTLVSGSHDVDIDAPQSDPQWAENDSNATGDVNTYQSTLNFDNGTRYLLSSAQADYTVCSSSNGYTSYQLSFKSLSAGQFICFLTSDRRYAAARIVQIADERITLDVDTYDPPIAS